MRLFSSIPALPKAASLGTMLLLTGLLSACDQGEGQNKNAQAQIRPVKTFTIAPTDAAIRRDYPATVLPAQQADLSFRVSGQIIELPIRAAQQVEKDQIIAKLDTRDLENQIAQLQSQLDQAEANLAAMTSGARPEDVAALQAAQAAAMAKTTAAEQQLERSRTLFKKGVITKAQLDNDTTALTVAKAELESRHQELIKGQAGSRPEEISAQEAGIKGLNAQIQAAQNNLADATLRAPFSGVIAKRVLDNFVNVQAKEPVAILQKLDRLDLVLDIPASDVARFSSEKHPQVHATLDALPDQRFEVMLVDFSTQADAATQTFRARVSMKPPQGITILPGMTGRIWVVEKLLGKTTLSIPITALASAPDGSAFVWIVQKDNKVIKRSVTAGEITAAMVEIRKGLKPGEVIASAGISALQAGQTVAPVTQIGD
ncbi:MAG: efflux RND transporter periplasmic adaptor subunit [Cohaesibacter sp.]|nr:efflux RND transporter periplasmic adaptor subunit [Cohaesibacter sp.]